MNAKQIALPLQPKRSRRLANSDVDLIGRSYELNTEGCPMTLFLIEDDIPELDGDGWLDADEPLTAEEKALLEARLADIEERPEKSIPWEEAKRRIESRFGK
jgi:hypothetical protein